MKQVEARGRHVRLPMEVREADGGVRVEGYAAVFGQRADIGGFFFEQIERGAFADALGRDDVVFLFNHQPDTMMARTRTGTLELDEDDHGLRMAATLDTDDPDVQRVVAKMRRGDLDRMSFAFRAEVEEWDDSGDTPVRTIKQASLHDVSAVTTPAYDGTEIGLRSLDAFVASKMTEQNQQAARLRRMRMNLRAMRVADG